MYGNKIRGSNAEAAIGMASVIHRKITRKAIAKTFAALTSSCNGFTAKSTKDNSMLITINT